VLSTLLAVLLAGGATWDASLRTEGRGGSVPNANTTTVAPTGGTLQVNGTLGLSGLLDQDTTYTASYQARWLQISASEGAPGELMNVGNLGLVYRLSGISRLSFNESFAYGRQDYSNLVAAALAGAPPAGTTTTPTQPGPGQTGNGQPVTGTSPTGQTGTESSINTTRPIPVSLVYLATTTSAGFDTALTHLLKLTLTASYFITGGADAPAQLFIPLQRGISVASNLGWTASRDDVLTLTLAGTGSRFSDHSQTETASGQLGWRHSLDQQTSFDAGLGMGVGASQNGAQPTAATPFPVATAGLTHTVPLQGGASLSGSVHATLTPAIDPITGGVYELVAGNADGSWAPGRELRFNAHFGIGHALSGSAQQGQEIMQGELSTTILMTTRASFSFGGRLAREVVPEQTVPDPMATPTNPHTITRISAFNRVDWGVFAAITIGARGAL
jgi:hypothetical protein